MPELPDVVVYLEALETRILGAVLERIRIAGPFLLHSVTPPLEELHGRKVTGVRRLGKRIVIDLEGGYHLVIHLIIAGRFRWADPGAKIPGRLGQSAFDFDRGTLILTEAGTRKRATLHAARTADLAGFDRGGIEPLATDAAGLGEVLRRENHTIKRSLTDPRLLSGIGNAYSDEILHRARLSPLKLTRRLTDDEVARLHAAMTAVLGEWVERLRKQAGKNFPIKVTAFRPEMAVHGKFGEPCPECGSPVQRIVYAENETNYCAPCQTGGKLLADRAMSRLLKKDWPRSLEELEDRRTEIREIMGVDE